MYAQKRSLHSTIISFVTLGSIVGTSGGLGKRRAGGVVDVVRTMIELKRLLENLRSWYVQ